MIYTFIGHFVGNTVSGWSSLMISIWFLGGVQLLSIGVIGQYIGKTYVEVKERPRYNIDVLLESKSVGKKMIKKLLISDWLEFLLQLLNIYC